MNTPYVKRYKEDGSVANPIPGEFGYYSNEPNRKARRKKKPRFAGESKNHHLTVIKGAKFKRVLQVERDKKGDRKRILHYIEQK